MLRTIHTAHAANKEKELAEQRTNLDIVIIQKDNDIRSLEAALTLKVTRIQELSAVCAANDQSTDQKLRDLRGDLAVKERELKSELTRVMAAMEHCRFDAEVATQKFTASETQRAEDCRLAAMLIRGYGKALQRSLEESETTTRQQLEFSASTISDAINEAMSFARRALTTHAMARDEHQREWARLLELYCQAPASERLAHFSAVGQSPSTAPSEATPGNHHGDDAVDGAPPRMSAANSRDDLIRGRSYLAAQPSGAGSSSNINAPGGSGVYVYSSLPPTESVANARSQSQQSPIPTITRTALQLRAERAIRGAMQQWDAEALEKAKEIAQLKESLAAAVAGLKARGDDLTQLEGLFDLKLRHLRDRMQCAEAYVETCRRKLHDTAGQRVVRRARDRTLDDVIASHEEEVAELKRTIATLEDTERLHRHTNKIDAFVDLDRRHQAAVAELSQCRATLTTETRLRAALEVTAADAEGRAYRLHQDNVALRSSAAETARTIAILRAESTERDDYYQQDHARLTAETQHLMAERGQLIEEATEARRRITSLERKCIALEAKAADATVDATKANVRLAAAVHKALDAVRYEAPVAPGAPVERQGGDAGGGETTTTAADGGSVEEGQGDDTASTAAIVRHLDNQLLVTRRDNAILRRRLDEAIAEVSAAEARRGAAVERSLALLTRQDAAPRREVSLLQQGTELAKLEQALNEREAVLQRREVELEKKEQSVAGKLSVLNHGAKGNASGMFLAASPSRQTLNGPRDGDFSDCGDSSRSSVTAYTHLGTSASPRLASSRLIPIAMRMPPSTGGATAAHRSASPTTTTLLASGGLTAPPLHPNTAAALTKNAARTANLW